MEKNFIEEMRSELESKRNILQERVAKLMADKTRQGGALNADSSEQAVEIQNDEVIDALTDAERKELSDIEIALKKIENGTYGICEVSGEEIEEKRLRAVPYAKTCMEHSS
jgi:DnaK suppressor protein